MSKKPKELTGYKYVAITHILSDCYNKEYAFALYDEDYVCWQAIASKSADDDDNYFVVSANGNMVVAKLLRIETLEEYMRKNNGQKPKKEVVCACDTHNYSVRLINREVEAKKNARKAELSKTIDERIATLKNAAYYRRLADEFGDKDAELKQLIEELIELTDRELVEDDAENVQ